MKTNKIMLMLIIGILVLSSLKTISAQKKAPQLIIDVVEAVGGINKLKSLKDVQYEYTFRNMASGINDVSLERYIFNREISWAEYSTRQYYVLPDIKGNIIQFYDGQKTTSTVDGKLITEQQPAYVGHFFRKTNFYWFNMMYKLLDNGINYELLADRKVNEMNYKIVKMTFAKDVGETSDTYILYINPKTKLIDQFLFTVLGFGFKEPFLMKVKYENINGLKLPTHRKYAPANWEGGVIKKDWTEQISKNIKFNNEFTTNQLKNTNQ